MCQVNPLTYVHPPAAEGRALTKSFVKRSPGTKLDAEKYLISPRPGPGPEPRSQSTQDLQGEWVWRDSRAGGQRVPESCGTPEPSGLWGREAHGE